MKRLTCEMCGSLEMIKQEGLFICQSCGTRYSVEDAKKMMVEIDGPVEVGGTVKIDHSASIKNLYQLARMDIDKDGCGNAQRYYESILLEEPTSWEAHFFVEYTKCWNSRVREMTSAPATFSECFENVFGLIKANLADTQAQYEALATVYARSEKLFDAFLHAAKQKYEVEASRKPYVSDRPDLVDIYSAGVDKANIVRVARGKLLERCDAILEIPIKMGDSIEAAFADNQECLAYAPKAWKKFAEEYMALIRDTGLEAAPEFVAPYVEKIKKYEPSYVLSDLPESVRLEIENTLKNEDMLAAVKVYRAFSGKGFYEAKAYIAEFAAVNGFAVSVNQEPADKGAEAIMSMLAAFALTPFTCLGGIFVLCFIGKAKTENGGTLSAKAKRYVITGVVGFFVWAALYAIMFLCLA